MGQANTCTELKGPGCLESLLHAGPADPGRFFVAALCQCVSRLTKPRAAFSVAGMAMAQLAPSTHCRSRSPPRDEANAGQR